MIIEFQTHDVLGIITLLQRDLGTHMRHQVYFEIHSNISTGPIFL